MVYKLLNEEGNFIDIETGEPRNIVEAEIAYTPEGINVGWTEFDCIEDAMIGFSVKKKTNELQAI
jgi:hypothetical protein